MGFDSDLRGAHGCERVNHSEPVSSAGGDSEYFQWSVCHESCVGVSELSLSVDENRFGVLARVDGQSSWVPLSGVLVQPIADEHDVGSKIVVVKVAVGVLRWWLSDHDAAIETIKFLQTSVSVPEVGSCVSLPLIPGI